VTTQQTVVEGVKLLTGHPLVLDFQLVGSAVYHPEPKDVDFLVLVKDLPPRQKRSIGDQLEDILDGDVPAGMGPGFLCGARWAFGPDWTLCAGEYDDQNDEWGAIRRGGLNLIITIDPEWYKRAAVANEVCAALKLMDKGDRVVVYRVIRDGYTAEQANARRDGTR
jgi:hypothetical protein